MIVKSLTNIGIFSACLCFASCSSFQIENMSVTNAMDKTAVSFCSTKDAAEEWVEIPLTQGEVLEGGTVVHLYPGSVVSYRDVEFPDSEPTVIRCGEDADKRSIGVSFDFVIVSVAGKVTKEVLES